MIVVEMSVVGDVMGDGTGGGSGGGGLEVTGMWNVKSGE